MGSHVKTPITGFRRAKTFFFPFSIHFLYVGLLVRRRAIRIPSQENSMYPKKQDSERLISVEGYFRLLGQVASGSLEGLQCPECHLLSVSVCFTPHAENECRSWFICASCDFRARAHNTAKPSRTVQARIVSTGLRKQTPVALKQSPEKRSIAPSRV
jgi:hypothetical protein